MTGKVLDSGASGALVLILPMALVIVVLLTAWPVILLLIVLSIGVRIWQNHQWKQWCKQIDPFFHQLIKANQGCLTPMDLSLKANLTGRGAKQFLDKKAEEYGAQRKEENRGTVYYFLTASALGSIFDDSEPAELDEALEPEQLTSASSIDVPQSSASNIAQLVVEKKQTSDDSSQTKSEQESASDKRPEAQIDSENLAQQEQPSSASVEHKASIPVEEIDSQTKLATQESQSSTSVEHTVSREETDSQDKSTQQESQSSTSVEHTVPKETESKNNLAHSESQSSAPIEHKASIPVEEIDPERDTTIEESADLVEALAEHSSAESSDSSLSLIQAELAKRLDLHSSTVGKRKSDSDFSEWSQSRDPEGIAWQYVPETKMFVPSEEVEQD